MMLLYVSLSQPQYFVTTNIKKYYYNLEKCRKPREVSDGADLQLSSASRIEK